MTPSDTSGRRHERSPEAHEDDPTGIRDLLAALPDPGPMPEDLVARIEARLAVEQAHREQTQHSDLAARSDTVVDLAAERSHRRPGRTVALLGVAAAGLLVATVAIGELGLGPAAGPAFDSAAQVSPRDGAAGADSSDAGSDSAGGAVQQGDGEGLLEAAGEDADEPEGATTEQEDSAADGALDDMAVEVSVLPELGRVDLDDYADRILEVSDTTQGGSSLGSGAASGLTETQARWCWQEAEPSEDWPTTRAAGAEMDGDRVVVLLGMRDATVGEALLLPWGCTTGEDVAPLDSVSWAP